MANKKINELDSRASLSLSDLLAVGDPTTGYLYKITITDLKTLTGAGVISFNGRIGSVSPAEGDYTLNQLGDVIITSATSGDIVKFNGSNWVNVPMYTGTVAQYVDGTGAYQTFPTLLSSDRLITQVRNTTGATITKGTVIYLNGSSGTLPLIAKAQANAESTSTATYGVVQDDIANNANGYVVVIGNLTAVDTSAYSAGAILWLSPTVAGSYTTTKPSAPNHAVYVGIVTRSSSTQGTIEVKIQNGYELEELHNVAISSVANNDLLVYESSSTLWKNKSISTILGYTPVSGTGTSNYIPKFTGSAAIGNSTLQEISSGRLQLGSSGVSNAEFDLVSNNGVSFTLYEGYSYTSIQSYNGSAFAIVNSISGISTDLMNYDYTSKTLSFQTNGNNTRLNITSLGNIGIGNTNNTFKLDVSGTGRFTGQLTLSSTITNGTYTYTLPGATGTIALTSDIPSLTGYIPYTGATADLNTGVYYIYTNNLVVTSGGSGFLAALTADTLNSIGILNLTSSGKNGYLKPTTLAADRTWTLPNATGTIALTSDLSSYVPTSRTITINGTTYDLSANRSWTVSGSQWTTSGSDIYYNTGNVGIGNSPTDTAGFGKVLDITGTSGSSVIVRSASTANLYTFLGQDNSYSYLYTKSTPLLFYVNNAEKVRITAAGNVSIGNTNDTYKLDVTGTGRFTGALTMGTPNSSVKAVVLWPYSDNAASRSWTWVNDQIAYGDMMLSQSTTQTGSSYVQRMYFSASGNVGIGTTSPSQKLSVGTIVGTGVASSSPTCITLDDSFGNNTVGTNFKLKIFQDNATNRYGLGVSDGLFEIVAGSTGAMGFFTNGANERMRITSGGNAGIGTTSPNARFHVKGIDATSSNNNIFFESTTNLLLRIRNDGYTITGDASASPINNTTGSAANMFIDIYGGLGRSTSSLKYKKDVRNYDKGIIDVMKIRPVYYRGKNDGDKQFAGLIAEEIHELGLTEFVQYAKDGTPDALAYQNMIALAFKAIQELKTEIDILKNK